LKGLSSQDIDFICADNTKNGVILAVTPFQKFMYYFFLYFFENVI